MITVFVLGQAPTYTGNTYNRTQTHKLFEFEAVILKKILWFQKPLLLSVNLLCVHNEKGQACYANFKGFFANDYTNLRGEASFQGRKLLQPGSWAGDFWASKWQIVCDLQTEGG